MTFLISTIVDGADYLKLWSCQYDFFNFYYCRLILLTISELTVNMTFLISTIVDL